MLLAFDRLCRMLVSNLLQRVGALGPGPARDELRTSSMICASA